jgi:hypothetical protein
MRVLVLAAAAAVGLAAMTVSTEAAPAMPHGLVAGGPAIVLVRGGCGPGFHRRSWRGRYHWHSECVPDRPIYRRPGACPPGMRLRTWRDPYGHWHRRCVSF